MEAPCPALTLDVRIDCKPVLSADDDTRLFANTFNMPHDLYMTEKNRREFWKEISDVNIFGRCVPSVIN